MTSYELNKSLKEMRNPEHCFIKFWRKEQDFLDFDLLERFVTNFRADQTIDGFELLGLEEMWRRVQLVAGDKVSRVEKAGSEVVLWRDKATLAARELPYNPETLITIFDDETDDNYIDS